MTIRRTLFAAAVAALTLLAAGCGAVAKAPSVASVGTAGSTTAASSSARRSGVLYASCMRAHGVPDFPDAAVSVIDGQVEIHVPAAIKSESQFMAASRTCQRDLPAGVVSAKPSGNIEAQLKFAKCMRSHGISDFPDPMRGGGFDVPGNTDSPQFEAAETTCQAKPSGGSTSPNGS